VKNFSFLGTSGIKENEKTFTVRCLLSFSNESQLVTILQVL
jgi:hypothetical protein